MVANKFGLVAVDDAVDVVAGDLVDWRQSIDLIRRLQYVRGLFLRVSLRL